MAIWHEVNGRWPYDDTVARSAAESMVSAAAGESLAPLEPEGVALDQAIRAGTVTVSSTDFRAIDAPQAKPDEPPYAGAGTLTPPPPPLPHFAREGKLVMQIPSAAFA